MPCNSTLPGVYACVGCVRRSTQGGVSQRLGVRIPLAALVAGGVIALVGLGAGPVVLRPVKERRQEKE